MSDVGLAQEPQIAFERRQRLRKGPASRYTSTVLHRTVLHRTVHRTVLHRTVLHRTVHHRTVLQQKLCSIL
jgi:hypothetical protein